MALTQLLTRAQLGIDAPEVRVEVHISGGLPAFTIVGLPETAVREARDRVRSAILNSGFEFPMRRITVNLAPADLPKVGGRYDLPIALGILAASEQVDVSALAGNACYGELALSGECRQIDGLLPALITSRHARQAVVIPRNNSAEAGLVRGLQARIVDSLAQLCACMNGSQPLEGVSKTRCRSLAEPQPDLAEVYGQFRARRALEIAAAGGHHLLMMGPPGTGKSMLAQRLISILPPLSEDEAMSSASIRSLCQLHVSAENWRRRPFQSPHHTVSSVALAGGGSHPRPGEISLAHNGVLFLDELTEFKRGAVEVLREPLETGQIHIARASWNAVFPARFQLVAAMNPCPGACESIKACDCSPRQLDRYRDKLSAPLLDRIDIQIELARLARHELLDAHSDAGESSAAVAARVLGARKLQLQRQGCLNSRLENRALADYCALGKPQAALLAKAIDKLRLSARSYHKILRLARSIADLEGVETIRERDVAEAISYRRQQS